MKERPILFSGEMVRAILDGRKTMTRRAVKTSAPFIRPLADKWHESYAENHFPWGAENKELVCPYGTRGDCLWVRETFAFVNDDGNEWIDYKATPRFPGESEIRAAAWDNAPDDLEAIRWRPSIFMPRSASRINLEITNVRVERLQDISEADAKAEGVPIDDSPCDHVRHRCQDIGCLGPGYRSSFCNLWDKINGKKHPWSSNPWVRVIEFKKI